MPDTLKITLAQLNQSVGDIGGNADGVLATRDRARGSDLIVFPELHLIGYPPEDLILKPSVIERAAAELERLAQASASAGPAMLVGSAFVLDGALHNGVALLDGGKVQAVRLKHELPNYGTFDELRLFHPGPLPEPVIVRGTMLGVPISEDIWRSDVSRHLADFGAEILLCINGSPYEINKEALRIAGVAKRRAVDTGLPLAYLNRVGGQDELVFDGASFVINGDGSLAVQMRDWEAQEVETRWTKTAQGWRCDRGALHEPAAHPEDIYCAMVLGLRDFVDRNRSSEALVGLDGSLGGATCAAVAADALGAERVRLVALPSRSSVAPESAAACARALGCRLLEVPFGAAMEHHGHLLVGEAGAGIAQIDFSARIADAMLMTLAEARDATAVVSTDKSGLSLGIASVGGHYSPLKDAYRSTVEAIARWRNGDRPRIGLGPEGSPIPWALLDGSGQVASPVGLPDYAIVDPILQGLVEQDKSVEQLASEGFDPEVVKQIEALLHAAEHKRRRSPPGVKLTARNFGRDRRYPITHAFRSG
jgi:NAD+ synthase